jgi:hypothetical protein
MVLLLFLTIINQFQHPNAKMMITINDNLMFVPLHTMQQVMVLLMIQMLFNNL